jgi:GTP 3',8-cyclase
MENGLTDGIGRKIDYLRIAVTDRCNLRCVYCMPEKGVPQLKRDEMLTFEELLNAVEMFAGMGITKVRITGGEPLARNDIVKLISSMKGIEKLKDISLTTNGVLLSGHLKELKEAGIRRINISIDSLNPEKYKVITRGGDLKAVFDSLEDCIQAGFAPVKINTVLSHYIDKQDIEDLVKLSIDKPVSIRFIEMMDPVCDELAKPAIDTFTRTGYTKVVDEDIFKIIGKYGSYHRLTGQIGFGPSIYYKIKGAKGSVGFISNNSEACSFCNRIRLTPTGKLKLCLFSDMEFNLRDMLRNNAAPEIIKTKIKEFIKSKPPNRKAGISPNTNSRLKLNEFMNKIGG